MKLNLDRFKADPTETIVLVVICALAAAYTAWNPEFKGVLYWVFSQ